MAKSSAKSPAGRRAREGPRRNTARSCPITSALSASAGRTLNESDTATAEKAVVVNEAFVKDYLADVANPLGQRVYIGKMFGFEQPWRIVGVVSDARQFNLRSAPPASVFVSALQLANAEGKFQSGQRALKFVIRTTGDPLQLGAAV